MRSQIEHYNDKFNSGENLKFRRRNSVHITRTHDVKLPTITKNKAFITQESDYGDRPSSETL